MWGSPHLSVLSFQCPADYREEMERRAESSGGEKNVLPTKRSLINLHKKVLITFNIAL